jgi:hypothetical protein
MSLIKSRVVAGFVAAGLVVAGATTAVAVQASAASTPITLKFKAVGLASHNLGKTHFSGAEVDKQNGKVIGHDVFTGTFDAATNKVKLQVALGIKGGFLLLDLQPSAGTHFTGTVTGGTGKYAGATGTITAHSPSQNSNKTFVTIHYTLP